MSLVVQIAPIGTDSAYQWPAGTEIVSLVGREDREDWWREHGGHVTAIITSSMVGLANALMDRLPNLGLVANFGVGLDLIDLEHASARGVRVTYTPTLLVNDVADVAIMLIVASLRKLVTADAFVRQGAWPASRFPLGRSLAGRRLGIFGLGRIGAAVATRAQAFGMVIGYVNPSARQNAFERFENLALLASWCDVLVLTAPATPQTNGIVDREVLDAIGPDGLLVNVARGALVDERALADALTQGCLGLAALDVFAGQPNVPEWLLAAPNLLVTPHIGSASIETRRAMADHVFQNVRAFAARKPLRDVANPITGE